MLRISNNYQPNYQRSDVGFGFFALRPKTPKKPTTINNISSHRGTRHAQTNQITNSIKKLGH